MSARKIAFVFPGQGSQAVGMGRDAAERSATAAGLFAQADATLGYGLKALCLEGPEDELKKTENTQPALYVSSAATLAVLAEAGLSPAAVAGHSLGEYTALYAAGCFDFATGAKLVRTRGEAFAKAGAARPGAMAAIMGLDIAQVLAVCAAASTDGKVAVAANINDPAQIVISGDPEAIAAACEGAKAAGAKRALPLPVSGAFHSPLVAPAADTMRVALAAANFTAPACAFVNNVDAALLSDPIAIKDSLVRQVTGSVRWAETVERLAASGITDYVEVGSGKVLSGLIRRIHKEAVCHTTENAAAIDKTLEALKA
ncbi:ACP S-malonyltransferase [bacterium]|nr:ACP S-malonyltransferase [bacterium]